MKRYKCVAKCPELDLNNEHHCVFTEGELESIKEYDEEICPCGNREKLILIEDSETKLDRLFKNGWFLVNANTLQVDINDTCETIDNIEEFNNFEIKEDK